MSTEKPSPIAVKTQTKNLAEDSDKKPETPSAKKPVDIEAPTEEKGGFKDHGLPEPTRYGDWEVKGRCSDF